MKSNTAFRTDFFQYKIGILEKILFSLLEFNPSSIQSPDVEVMRLQLDWVHRFLSLHDGEVQHYLVNEDFEFQHREPHSCGIKTSCFIMHA